MQNRDFSQNPLKVFFSYYSPHKRLFALDILMALLGVIGMILWIVYLLRKTEDAEADDDEAEEDDVPELAEDEL